MGNTGSCFTSSEESQSFPVETRFKLSSPLPSWPQGEGFASGTIDLGGLEVCQVTSFKRIWSTSQDGSNDTDVTFFEPSPIPDGFSLLGCYCQFNDTPLFGWLVAGKDVSGGTLVDPVDYTLVWSSMDLFYIWLPAPPEGYKSVGYAITTSPEKPSLNKIRCVRADLTEDAETDALLWGSKEVSVYGLRPKVRGKQAQGVSVGTFIILKDGDDPNLLSLSCLRNNNFQKLTSFMPNLAQIDALIQEYSPRFYFHPKETYFPASTTWYFTNGVQLYHTGDESNPVAVEPTGSNLPQDGSNDGTYWLDLPVDETERERVKKGDLQSSEAYIHVKPSLGATFTDLAVWLFYPFNGPSTAKFGLVDIPLGRIGEHIGDWEHVTLRVSNFDGLLYRVYYAQHSGGTWVDTPALEFLDTGNSFAAYPSLNGHATYPTPGLVVQGTDVIGIRNDAAKSENFFDVRDRYLVMSADHSSDVKEPAWVNFRRKWGPKITYEIGTEIEKLRSSFTGTVGTAIGSLVNIIPREFSSEDGPTGPKMKAEWDGDERAIVSCGDTRFPVIVNCGDVNCGDRAPPEGYKSVGYAITTSPEKPSLNKIRCVRADLTEDAETDALLWGSKEVSVYGLRPKVRGKQAQGVSVGTFIILKDGDDPNLLSLSCLRNNNFQKLTSFMPNLAQIDALIQEYSPRFYFHPKETYFPASTTWYFTNGVQLYHTGDESNPVAVEPTGSNLPQDGSNDGTYWLDLPVDETERERVKKGDLQSSEAYIHVKPSLGATFTDLAVWLFYPFNGPSTAKFGLVDIPLGRIGEHIGDWEHVTLRVSNFDGLLYRVYYAQHSGGTWVDTPALEFLDTGNSFAAYPSLNGHATYPTPGLVVQGTDVIGIRNDAAKSENFFDVRDRYLVMSADHSSDVKEPAWVNFRRKWGPKITYEIGTEIEKLRSSFTGTVGTAIGSLVNIIPREFSSEDGPTGPKMKAEWDGDER